MLYHIETRGKDRIEQSGTGLGHVEWSRIEQIQTESTGENVAGAEEWDFPGTERSFQCLFFNVLTAISFKVKVNFKTNAEWITTHYQ